MRFSVQLPTDRLDRPDEFASGEAIAQLARASEAAGFDACYVTDHPFPPTRFLEAGGHSALDPFVALSVAAAATGRLRLHLNCLVLAYRNPFLAAHALASLDLVSGGRVIAGIAAGYLEDESRALGADFATRNARTDDAIAAMRAAWSGEAVRRAGPGYEARGNRLGPRPAQRPGPPLWIGGNSRLAIRRAVDLAEGWSPFPLPRSAAGRTRSAAIADLDDLRERIGWARAYAERQGRTAPLEIAFVPFGRGMNSREPLETGPLLEQLRALAALGVTWVAVGLPGEDRGAYLENIRRFGEEVIAAAGTPRADAPG